MCRVQIKSVDGRAHVILDGKDISHDCLSFSVSQDGPNWPDVTLTLRCYELDIDVESEKVSVLHADDKTAPTVADAVP